MYPIGGDTRREFPANSGSRKAPNESLDAVTAGVCSGRGLLLIRGLMTELRYHGRGNVVSMCKLRNGTGRGVNHIRKSKTGVRRKPRDGYAIPGLCRL